MGEPVEVEAMAAARQLLLHHDDVADAPMLDALETLLQAAHENGMVNVTFSVVSKAERRRAMTFPGERYADDIRAPRWLWDIAPWALGLLLQRVRELEAQQQAAGAAPR